MAAVQRIFVSMTFVVLSLGAPNSGPGLYVHFHFHVGFSFLTFLFRTLLLGHSPYHFRTKEVGSWQVIDTIEEACLSG